MPHTPMPGVRSARPRRPVLLALVFGVFLMLVGVTATALVVITSVHLSTTALDAVVSRDRALVELFVNGNLTMADLDAEGLPPARARELEKELAALTEADGILRVEIRAPDGAVLLSDHPGLRGERPRVSESMASALAGEPSATIVDDPASVDAAGPALPASTVVAEYLPIATGNGPPVAVFALWRDAAPIVASLEASRRDILLITLGAALVLSVVLFVVFRAAQGRLTRQQAQLVEATRRDALTDMLNHGTVVSHLADAIEAARRDQARIGVALIDIDNFRLFNDNHGHEAADAVLLQVADVVDHETLDGAEAARYGPDEFLVVRVGPVEEMEALVARIRARLADLSVQFGESEQLPVTASCGVAGYPEHADSVTELLSTVALALSEAKASGGDAVRVARASDERRTGWGSFDVLQGLVIAVDTKDHYTRRHSDDVARYAVFLAERLGLDDDARRTIRISGLLHDVGKIGIPDAILRKPAGLTAEELEIFKQHVALGDAIVRDLPHVELVREGIRHHHERWDGRGYLDHLEGDAIPLIGRIMAVADAFSAMTTTRPYRKALSVEEALKRLGDAAATQLDEDLVRAFIAGIETAPDAPFPGAADARVWLPKERVA